MNLSACSGLSRTPENAIWFRSIPSQFLLQALGYTYSKRNITRFNPGIKLLPSDQFATLYFADDVTTTQFEVGFQLGNFKPGFHASHPRLNQTTLNVQVVLDEVVDLTDPASWSSLDTNVRELTGDWEGYHVRNYRMSVSRPNGTAPTQELGRELFKTGIEAFRTISAKVPYQKILVVFPDNLKARSALTFNDPSGTYNITPITRQNHQADDPDNP